MSEWQPIETAPEDVEVIVFAPTEKPQIFTASDFGDGLGWQRQVCGLAAYDDEYFGDPDFEPTHWMPLPEPPKAT